MNKEEFLKVKEAYKSARTEEKERIKDFLLSKRDGDGNLIFLKEKDGTDTFVKTSGGSGRSNYSSGRTLSKQYDLTNHMWIDLSYKGNDILISLQSFDIDPNSNNLHVLYDRIGILFEKSKKIPLLKDCYTITKVSDDFLKMETTNWELPLSEAEMEEMVDYIISHYEK